MRFYKFDSVLFSESFFVIAKLLFSRTALLRKSINFYVIRDRIFCITRMAASIQFITQIL